MFFGSVIAASNVCSEMMLSCLDEQVFCSYAFCIGGGFGFLRMILLLLSDFVHPFVPRPYFFASDSSSLRCFENASHFFSDQLAALLVVCARLP